MSKPTRVSRYNWGYMVAQEPVVTAGWLIAVTADHGAQQLPIPTTHGLITNCRQVLSKDNKKPFDKMVYLKLNVWRNNFTKNLILLKMEQSENNATPVLYLYLL